MTSVASAPDAAPQRPASPALVTLCVCVLFTVSGTVGLTYEVAWKHLFGGVFGNTTYAVSIVISVFMGGLALGSYVFGRLADRTGRHLLIFSLLQLGIAVTGLLVPFALAGMEGFYGVIFRKSGSPSLLLGVQAVVSALILLAPTFLMGGTLPVLSRFLATNRRRVLGAVSLLYGLNTLGAALGAFLTGFVLIKAIGTLHTVYAAAGVNVLLAGAFWWLQRGRPAAPETEEAAAEEAAAEETAAPLSPGRLRMLLAAMAVSGFVSFSYEILWVRLLAFRMEASVYAFSMMLTVFLLGLGIGGAASSVLIRGADKRRHWRIFGCLETCIGLWGLISILLFFSARGMYASFTVRVLHDFWSAAIIMLVPTVLMGAAFPLVCHLYAAGVRQTGRSVGRVYVFNTIGGVLGALLTGFWLVKVTGTQGTLTLVSFIMVASGSAILLLEPRPERAGGISLGRVIAASACVLALVLFASTRVNYLETYFVRNQSVAIGYPEELVTLLGYEEGVQGVVVACQVSEDYKTISAGSTDVAGTSYMLRNTQKLQAHIPMLIHPDPQYVCQVGFGSGETAHLFSSYDVTRFDCVEISPAMLKLADRYFRDINFGVVGRDSFNAIVMDAAAYLKHTDQTYDIIANDATWPSQEGPAMLFTLEYFRHGRDHLRPGGIMTSWLPLDMPLQDLKSIMRTFHDVFPHVYLWSSLNHLNKHALIVGAMEPLKIDAAVFMERFRKFAQEDLSSVFLGDPAVLLACHVAKIEGLTPELDGAPFSTDHRPVLKFMHSRITSAEEMLQDAYRFLTAHSDTILDHLTNLDAVEGSERLVERIGRLDRANALILRAMAMTVEEQDQRARLMSQAIELAPEHPAGILVKANRQALADVTVESLPGMDLTALGKLARNLFRNAHYETGAAAYAEWISRAPDALDAHLGLANCLMRLGRLQEATGPLTTALALDAGNADVRFNLGTVHLQMGRADLAMPHLAEAVRLAPDDARAHALLGTTYWLQGNGALAFRHLARAVALDPDLPDARRNLGFILLRGNEAAEAVAHLERAVTLEPDNAEGHALLARAYAAIGNEEAAQRHAQRARELQGAAE